MSKIENWIKRIPQEYQENFDNLGRFKISLKECENKTQIKRAKQHLDLYYEKYLAPQFFELNKIKAQQLLKLSLKEYLYELNNRNTIDIKDHAIKVSNIATKVTLVDILDKEIETRAKEYNINLEQKAKAGINVEIKNDTTLGGYKTIRNHLVRFDLNKDYKALTIEDMEDFKYYLLDNGSKIGGVIGYFKYLKAIFNKLIKANKITFNPVQVPKKLNLENEEKQIFKYSEIENILKENNESSLMFKTLLLSGMRLDELSSIKKKDITNDNFIFFDSKDYFKKVVPIHETLIEDINSILGNIEDEDYLFFKEFNNNYRVQNIRSLRLMLLVSKHSSLTVHKTRTTFVSYLNYFSNGFGDKDIKSLTHKNSGIDDSFYVKKRNLNNLKSIVNSIDLKKLIELES